MKKLIFALFWLTALNRHQFLFLGGKSGVGALDVLVQQIL